MNNRSIKLYLIHLFHDTEWMFCNMEGVSIQHAIRNAQKIYGKHWNAGAHTRQYTSEEALEIYRKKIEQNMKKTSNQLKQEYRKQSRIARIIHKIRHFLSLIKKRLGFSKH